MRLTRTCTGLLAMALVGFFCSLSTEAYPEVESPQIVSGNVTRRGDRAVFSCKADPGNPDDFTLIYWLVNRTFIEMAYPDGRVREAEERAVAENGRVLIQRDLIFNTVRQGDYRANYTCVVNSPAGMDKITLRMPRKSSGRRRNARLPWRLRQRRMMVKKARSHLKKSSSH